MWEFMSGFASNDPNALQVLDSSNLAAAQTVSAVTAPGQTPAVAMPALDPGLSL